MLEQFRCSLEFQNFVVSHNLGYPAVVEPDTVIKRTKVLRGA